MYLKNEGRADGGVEGAHAIEDSVTGLQVSQQGGVGVREDLMVPLPALMPQVEDALDGSLQLRTHRHLIHLAGTRCICTACSCLIRQNSIQDIELN